MALKKSYLLLGVKTNNMVTLLILLEQTQMLFFVSLILLNWNVVSENISYYF